MATPVLICDDSSFARKQMARALPVGWDVQVSFACDGVDGLQAIKEGKSDVLFLDLNMPNMDGYEVLQAIREQDLPAMVIVVSGDIQPEAHERVMSLGALDFIKKPVSQDQVKQILDKYGLRTDSGERDAPALVDEEVDIMDVCKEIANVAMGRAVDLLARLLNEFVVMPVPNVNMLEGCELEMALERVDADQDVSAVCQGFIGGGVAGEAVLVFNESSFEDIAQMMSYKGEINDAARLELLMDIANILIGVCLKGIADQLDINFSQGHPVVLGQHVKVNQLIQRNAKQWRQILAIEMGYSIENRNFNCDLLLLFTEESLESLGKILSYFSD